MINTNCLCFTDGLIYGAITATGIIFIMATIMANIRLLKGKPYGEK